MGAPEPGDAAALTLQSLRTGSAGPGVGSAGAALPRRRPAPRLVEGAEDGRPLLLRELGELGVRDEGVARANPGVARLDNRGAVGLGRGREQLRPLVFELSELPPSWILSLTNAVSVILSSIAIDASKALTPASPARRDARSAAAPASFR